MKRHFSEEELKAASSAPQALGELIAESGGYALQKLKKAGMAPDLETLLERPSAESMLFILDHFDLTAEQQKKVAPFFANRLANKRLGGGAVTPEAVNEALKKGEAISPEARLSASQISLHADLITARYDEDPHGTERFIRASLNELSAGEISSLPESFLKNHLDMWASAPGAFDEEPARLLYKKLALQSAQEGRLAKGSWRDFSNWVFKAQDKEFLIELLAGHGSYWGINHEEMAKNASASELVSPWEFVTRVNAWCVSGLSMEQTALRKSEIQALWEAKALENGYGRLSEIASRAVASEEQFEEIVDAAFVRRLAAAGVRMDTDTMRDDQESRRREALLWRAMALAALGAPAGSDDWLCSYSLSKLMRSLSEGAKLSPQKADLALAERLVREKWAERLNSGSPEASFLLSAARDAWAESPLLGPMARALLARPTPNGLFVALSVSSRAPRRSSLRESPRDRALRLLAERLMRLVDPESGRVMAEYFGVAFKPGVKARARAPFADDFLKADYENLDSLDEGMLRLLCGVDKGFCQKIMAAGAKPTEKLALLALEGSMPGRVELLRHWIKAWPAEMGAFERFDAALAQHPDGQLIAPMDRASKEADSLARAGELARERGSALEAMELMRSRLAELDGGEEESGSGFDEDDDFDDENESPSVSGAGQTEDQQRSEALRASIEQMKEKEREQKARIGSLLSGVSFEAMKGALMGALKADDYELFEGLSLGAGRGLIPADLFAARARELSEERFVELLGSDGAFVNRLRSMVSYNGENKLELDFGDKEANMKAADAMLSIFEKDPLFALDVFSKPAARRFANEFAVSRFPERVVSEYRLAPEREEGGGRSSRGLSGRAYTDEEILSVWDALESSGSFFRDMDINARAGSFFADNFGSDRERVRAFLEKAKDRPKLYCLMCDSQLLRGMGQADVSEAPEGASGWDARGHAIFASDYDFDIVLKGVEGVIEDMERLSGVEGFNPKLARSVVDSVIWASYWDDRDVSGKTVYHSLLSEEQSVRLLRLLCEKAPAIVYGIHAIGVFGDAPAMFEKRSGEFLGERTVDDFIFPSVAVAPNGIPLGNRYECYANSYLKGVINWLIEGERHEDVEFLNWALKLSYFRQNELAYEFKSLGVGGSKTVAALEFLAESEPLQESLKVAVDRLELSEVVGANAARRRKSMRM